MPVKKKSLVTSRRNPRRPGNRAAKKQNTSAQPSAALAQSQPESDRRSRPVSGDELWVAEKTSLSRQQDVVAWSPRTVTPTDARLLELADIALGLRKREPFRRRKSAFFSKTRSSSSHS